MANGNPLIASVSRQPVSTVTMEEQNGINQQYAMHEICLNSDSMIITQQAKY